MASSSTSTHKNRPTCIIVLGMAGSGKTTFVSKLVEYLTFLGNSQPYAINLDPAVLNIPYQPNIDIRDTVKFKDVMSQYGFGPNGAIMTSLNFFASRFNEVIGLIDKNADRVRYVLIDTPGQIEVFTWSASGVIITETLSASYPTMVIYVMDTPRSHSPVTFMSNMLYACSVLYRMKLPFICVLNKTDVIDCDFALEWMRDFEAFQNALHAGRSGENGLIDTADGPYVEDDSSQYMNSLTNSMSLVLDEFYNDLRCCGVSSLNGEGFPKFLELVKEASEEYFNVYLPALRATKTPKRTGKALLNQPQGEMGVDSEDSDDYVNDQAEDGPSWPEKSMLVDLVGNSDNAETDPLVHLDGIEEKQEALDDQMSAEEFRKKCAVSTNVSSSIS
nr:GPN loop GTPase 1 [Hymenolepis microstoma]